MCDKLPPQCAQSNRQLDTPPTSRAFCSPSACCRACTASAATSSPPSPAWPSCSCTFSLPLAACAASSCCSTEAAWRSASCSRCLYRLDCSFNTCQHSHMAAVTCRCLSALTDSPVHAEGARYTDCYYTRGLQHTLLEQQNIHTPCCLQTVLATGVVGLISQRLETAAHTAASLALLRPSVSAPAHADRHTDTDTQLCVQSASSSQTHALV